MTNDICLSVLMPTYRREEELVKAIESVLPIQDITLEILVADDSPDGSAEKYVKSIKDDRVSYEKRAKPTGGLPAIVRNELTEKAKGKVLYFLDDDDTIQPETLTRMCRELLDSNKGVAIGAVNPHGDPDSPVVAFEKEHYAFARQKFQTYFTKYQYVGRLLLNMPLMVCSAGIVKREVFFQVGGFDTKMPLYEDIEFYTRAIRESGYIYVDEILLNRKTGGESLIQNETDGMRTEQSYGMMSRGYIERFGRAEYLMLKLMNKVGLC